MKHIHIILWVATCLCLLMGTKASAQQPDPSLWLEPMEQLSMEEGNTYNWEDELQELSRLLHEPLNLNTATRAQLEQFPFLSDVQIENILAYIYQYGQMQTLYELSMVEGMDRTTINRLKPFVCVEPVSHKLSYPSFKTLWKYGKHSLLTQVDVPFYKRDGYRTSYLGPSIYHSLRYTFHYSDVFEAGLTAEKDAGEPFFALYNGKGYDSYSGYFVLRRWGPVQTLAIGDYRLNFGQGLVLGGGLMAGKSFTVATSDYRSTGIRKHGSTDEYNFFRGVAATIDVMPCLQVSAFYSYRLLDGVVRGDTIASIQTNGLHRTRKEADKRRAATLQMAGGHVAYQQGAFWLGVTGIYYGFDRSYEPTRHGYARYNQHGKEFYNVSADYRISLARFSLSGEAAKGTRGYAFFNRLIYHFSNDSRLMLIHRHYSSDYWAFFARAWGRSTQNEKGIYLAGEITPHAKWKLFASVDLFSYPWWRYRISKPSSGWEGRMQATFTPSHKVSMYLNYRYNQQERDVTGTQGSVTRSIQSHKARYRLTWQAQQWIWQTTFDYTCFGMAGSKAEHGWQATQMCSYRLSAFPLSIALQGSWFDTDSYDTRMFIYEKGLLYSFYTPAFSGRGLRCSAHIRYDLNHWLTMLLKAGHTYYADRDEIGSGSERIRQNTKTDLQIQLRLKF